MDRSCTCQETVPYREHDYLQVLRELSEALAFGMEPSLEGIRALTEAMGRPQTRFSCIQIAGTNGKSSTARMVAALLRAEGFHVGLYTSPELVEYPERFELDGRVIDHGLFARHVGHAFDVAAHLVDAGVGRLAPSIDHAGRPASASGGFTEFELLTAAAFSLFAEAEVDFAVLEVGLGGRWDATSIVHPAVACITGIGLDHTRILGDTLEAIAGEKAAIIEPAAAVVLGPGTSPVADVFCDRADACDTFARAVRPDDDPTVVFPRIPDELTTVYHVESTSPELMLSVDACHGDYPHIALPQPPYQAPNVATAITVAEAALGRALDAGGVRTALGSLRLPGRFETLREDPLLIIDAAHNPQGAHLLADAIRTRFGGEGQAPTGRVAALSGGLDGTASAAGDGRPTLLLAILADKDFHGIIRELAPVVGDIVVTQTASDRAIPVEELALVVEEDTGIVPRTFAMPSEAVAALERTGESVVAAGSITLAGEVAELFLEED